MASSNLTGGGGFLGGNSSGSIGEWWQDVVTTNEIRKIKSSEKVGMAEIEFQYKVGLAQVEAARERAESQYKVGVAQVEAENKATEYANALNQKIFGLTSSLFGEVRGQVGKSPKGTVPSEFDDMIALFEAGGQFGEGAKAEIEQGQQQALAAGQMGFAQTGMSSGTNVAGLQARTAADAALSKAKVEDERVKALGGALESKGGAALAAQSIAQSGQASLLQALTSLKPNFVAA